MALTSDSLISMHKVTTDVIEMTQRTSEALNTVLTDGGTPLTDQETTNVLFSLNNAIEALAVVQRDLLKAALGG